MQGLMQDHPLTVSMILRHAQRMHPRKTIATRTVPFGASTKVSLPLPTGAGARSVLPVHLRFSTSVVPHDAGVGPDTRRLALVVTNVYVR